jgi:hypothetical protein
MKIRVGNIEIIPETEAELESLLKRFAITPEQQAETYRRREEAAKVNRVAPASTNGNPFPVLPPVTDVGAGDITMGEILDAPAAKAKVEADAQQMDRLQERFMAGLARAATVDIVEAIGIDILKYRDALGPVRHDALRAEYQKRWDKLVPTTQGN